MEFFKVEYGVSTLYGNKIAIDFANKYKGAKYPIGSFLYEVIWEQQPDSVWFGAKISSKLTSVEKIKFMKGDELTYTIYKGKPLKKTKNRNAKDRLTQITSQRFAVIP